jgi:hypothetical protein
MPEVVISTDDLVVLGGPASISLDLDVGATGTRGSYIFTDVGKPTSDQISLSPLPLVGDLYININPSDDEYLFLYQYKIVNGVITWAKVLRLIPNTVLFNPFFKFINGEAYTPVLLNNTLLFIRGVIFSLFAGGLENEQLETLDARDLNIQMRVNGDSPVMSTFIIEDINTTFTGVTYIVANTGSVVQDQTVALNQRYLLARLTIAEFNAGTSAVELVNGYRKVDFLATVGGRTEVVIDISEVQVYSSDPADAIIIAGSAVPFPGGITVPGNTLVYGDKIVYLANNNTEIVGLDSGTEYFVAYVEDSTVVLSPDGVNPVVFTDDTLVKTHSIIDLGGVEINV